MNPNEGVLYSIHGRRYWPQIVVSICSLRQHYQGPVEIMALDDDGYEIAKRIASRPDMQPVQVTRPHINVSHRNGGYAAKPKLPALSSFTRGVFIDADTVVAAPFMDDMLPQDEQDVVLTQFSNWTTAGPRIGGRCRKWMDYAPDEVAAVTAKAYPAVNTGVYGYRRESDWSQRDWDAMTQRHISFICDEIAAQLLVPSYLASGRMAIRSDRYNCSPIYVEARDFHQITRIWHFHGGKHLRPGMCRNIWWAAYLKARETNLAGICDWATTVDPLLEVKV